MTKNLHTLPWGPSGRPPEHPREDAGDVCLDKHSAVEDRLVPCDLSGPGDKAILQLTPSRPLPHKVPVTELEPWTVKMCSIVSTHTHSLIKTQLIDWLQAPRCSVHRMPALARTD